MSNMYPVNSFVLCLCALFVFGIAASGVVAESRNVTIKVTNPLNVSNTPKLVFGFCKTGYSDITYKTELRFSKDRFAKIPPGGRMIGNGKELQCRASSYCSLWAPSSAVCTPIGSWQQAHCTMVFQRTGFRLSDLQLDCARQDNLINQDCVFDGSCVLYYSLTYNGTDDPTTQINVGALVVAGIIVLVVAICCCRCCQRRRARPAVLTTTTVVQNSSTSTREQTIVRPAVATYVAHPVQALPYPPMYQPGQAAPPAFAAATMQHAPPYPQQAAASGSQPAFNPQYAPYPTGQGPYDAPPTYSPNQRKF